MELELIQQRIDDYDIFNIAIEYYIDSYYQEELDISEIEVLVKRKLEILNNNKRIIDILRGVKKIDLIDLKRKIIRG